MRPGVDQIDGYRIEGHVARGRSGDVYRAATADGPPVALKVHDRADDGRREAERLALVDHPGVVRVEDHGELPGGGAWLALTWIDGRTLAHLLATEGPLSLDRTRGLVRQLADALDALHEAGLVHGDLSPRNVMVDLHDRVTLVDLGAAGQVAEGSAVDVTTGAEVDVTTGAEVDTTPRYASPEVAAGRPATAASDRYALALITYEALTGSFPYPDVATPIAMLAHHASTEPVPPGEHRPQLPPAVDDLLLDALAKDPDERPSTGAELATALTGASLGQVRPRRRRPTRWIAAGLAMAGLAAAALVVAVASDDGVGESIAEPAATTASTVPGDVPPVDATAPSTIASTVASTSAARATTAPVAEPAPTTIVAPMPEPWPAGTAAGLTCNRLEVPGFERAELPETFYSGDPSNTVAVAPGAGVDGSTALRIGSTGAFGIFAEIVPLGEEREHVFAAWIREQGEPAVTAFHVDYLDVDFEQITFGREAAMREPNLGDADGRRVVVRTTAPAGAAFAIPSVFKDGSPGSLLIDEAVFGDASACPELAP
ncbi:MAG: protein kinase [Actinomycetota bacterium]